MKATNSVNGQTFESQAVGLLRSVDVAHEGLAELILALAQQRHPVGSIVDFDRVSVIVGEQHAAHFGRVRSHSRPEVDLARPELTGILMECVALRRDGTETQDIVWVKAYLVNHKSMTDSAADRQAFLELVRELDDTTTVDAVAA